MNAKLVIVGGKASRSELSVTLPAVIGRSRRADLTVAHPMISRKHCELYEADGLVKVRDLGSLNGTFIGKEKVSDAALYPSDEFTVGPLTFRVEYEYGGQITAPQGSITAVQPAEKPRDDGLGDVEEPRATEPGPAAGPTTRLDEGKRTLPGEGQSESDGVQPAIAPAGGELPDFSAWAREDGEPDEEQPSEEPSVSPPPPFFPGGSTRQAGAEQPASDQQPPAEREATEKTADLPGPPGSGADESGPAEQTDEDLDEFLKGFQ